MRDTWLYVVFSVAIAGVVIGGLLWYAYEPGGPLNPAAPPVIVTVHEVIWEQGNSSLGSAAGFTAATGWTVPLSWWLTCDAFFGYNESCKTGSVYILTAGFGLASTNAPATWYSGTSSAGFQVTVSVLTPSTNYTGDLVIDLY